MTDWAHARTMSCDFIPIVRALRLSFRVSGSADNDPLRSLALADKPECRINLRIALPGHDLVSLTFQMLAHHLHGHVVSLPRSHFDFFLRDQGGRIDRRVVACVNKSPSAFLGAPFSSWETPFHRHEACAAIGFVGQIEQAFHVPRAAHFTVSIDNSDEKYLVAESEGKVLKKRRVWMSTKPALYATLNLGVQVHAGRFPAFKKIRSHFLRVYFMHGFSLIVFRAVFIVHE